jgi:hypothetical protein
VLLAAPRAAERGVSRMRTGSSLFISAVYRYNGAVLLPSYDIVKKATDETDPMFVMFYSH